MKGPAFPSRRLVAQDDAAIVEHAGIPRSRFLGSWTHKTTFDAGLLVPFLVDEVLPGDHLKYDVTAYVRMATPLFPLFDNQRIDTFFFFVPNRLVWTNWPKLMGEQAHPSDSINYTVPQVPRSEGGYPVGSLQDHMGLPISTQVSADLTHSALPLRMVNKIWNQWFRDQNIQAPLPEHMGDGPDPHADYNMPRRNKSHDYFTSLLPWPQKFTAPNVSIGGMAPVIGLGAIAQGTLGLGAVAVTETGGGGNNYAFYKQLWDNAGANQVVMRMSAVSGGNPQVFADLSQATGVSINVLRQAWLIQGLLERDARGGTRYVEKIRAHFGVTNPDFRLQRAEYIGGGQTPLQLTPIAQTAPSAGVPVGALGAAGTGVGNHTASYAATEHGYIIGFINVRSELSYHQGMHRHWSRLTQYDFYVPALAGLGEQAVLRKEIYMTNVAADNNTVFGYQERWHEYRTRYNEVTGLFHPGVPGTLAAWHLAQHFGSPPLLSATFIQEDPPMARVLAAGELAANQQYLADILINRNAVRPMPTFGTPVALGRF